MRNRASNPEPGQSHGWGSLAVILTLGLVLLALLSSGPRTWATVGQDSLYQTVPTRTPTPRPTDTPLPSPTYTPTPTRIPEQATATPTSVKPSGNTPTPTPTATPASAAGATPPPPQVLPVTGGQSQ
ncbi:MAG: hypothetical protein QHJ81_13215 [Anaerolineae bacterium]|nr:hypothetical protein [Anaerolineae bacterium]